MIGEERKNASVHRAFSLADLQRDEPEPIKWVVDGLLPAGLALLCGPSKIGKSWLALELAVDVSGGEAFLGFGCPKGEVLYLALEDTERRIYERARAILGNNPMPESLYFMNRAYTLSEPLLDEIGGFLKEHPCIHLIIVDTLQKIRGSSLYGEQAYAYDYREMSALKRFADERSICLLSVHHTRKASDPDRFNTVSGTSGIMGSADTIMILSKEKRDDDKALLSVTGRDIESEDYYISWDKSSHLWSMEETKRQAMEKKVLEEFSESLTVQEILKAEKPFEATASEISDWILRDFGKKIDPYKVGTDIQKFASMLEKRHGIIPESIRTASRRTHRFHLKGGERNA